MALVTHVTQAHAHHMDSDELRRVIGVASLAPSVHNTQPWQFTATGDGCLEVRADTHRQLRALDPLARQLLVSCGGAIEFARLAIRAAGRACAVDLLPDAGDPLLLAILRPGEECAGTPEEIALVDAAARRHTDRGPYDDNELPPSLLDELRSGVERYGLWLRHVDLPVDRVIVVGALSDAERRVAADPAYVAELKRWTTGEQRPDGIPNPTPAWPAGRVSDVPLRDFSAQQAHRSTRAGEPPVVERDTLVLLGSVVDDPTAHLATGRALAWLLLRITVSGLAGQPLGQAFDDLAGRVRLGSDLRLIGYPQFLLRMGYGHGVEHTARRRIEDVLVTR
ncbi:MAG: hypothetical protein QOC60_1817 [Frankiaceae bacterium]|nr:hypothetical protein [Frankiaceae bacterium]